MFASRRLPRAAALALSLTVLFAACGDRSGKELDEPIFPPPVPPAATPPSTEAPPTTAAIPLTLVAPWVDGAPIPERNTCDGAGVSPALTWSNIPPGTVELAVAVVDVDAGSFVHWIAYGISPATPGFAEGQLPEATFEWPNSSGRADWFPPCPPAGETHRYEFTVYALNQQLEAADDAPPTEVLSNLDATAISRSSVSGLWTSSG